MGKGYGVLRLSDHIGVAIEPRKVEASAFTEQSINLSSIASRVLLVIFMVCAVLRRI